MMLSSRKNKIQRTMEDRVVDILVHVVTFLMLIITI